MILTKATVIGTALLTLAFTTADMLVQTAVIMRPPSITAVGVVDAPVHAGETVLVHWTVDKKTDCPGENSRIWLGTDDFHITEARRGNGIPKTNGPEPVSVQTKIPELAPPGQLVMHVEGFYDCLGLAREYFTLGPVIMEVVE